MGQTQRDNKISIAFFDEAVAFGGSVVVLAHLFNHIDRSRFKPLLVTSLDEASIKALFKPEDMLCWFRPRLSYADRIRWMERYRGKTGIGKKLWAYLFSIVAVIANFPEHAWLFYKVWKERPSVVHINNGREGLMAARMFDIPFLIHLHGISIDFLTSTYDTRLRAALFVSISKYISAESMKCGVPAERILDIPNPAPIFTSSSVSADEWRARFKLPANAIVLAHVGRVIRWKGQLEFLEAFSRIAATCPNAYALIVGDDVEGLSTEYPRRLKQLVAEHGLNDRVVFTGHIGNIVELMAFADVVVHSSIDPEPFGLVITEAMSAGAAVIAARLGAPIELIDHGVTGLLIDPTNADEFAQGLKDLVTNEPLRKQMALAGQREAHEKYSPASFARKMEAVYRQVAQQEIVTSNR